MDSRYQPLNLEKGNGVDEHDARIQQPSSWLHPLPSRSRYGTSLVTLLSSLMLATVFVTIRDNWVTRNDYEYGFSTDIETPFRIPLVKVRASGSPIFREGNIMEMPPLQPGLAWPENVSYTGHADQQEEDNWAVLIDQASFPITVQEAKRAWPDNYQEYYLEEEGKYRAAYDKTTRILEKRQLTMENCSMDMFHTLHCVNVLRRLATPSGTYQRDIDPHINHCVEMIRQHVMCYGSTTLIPTKWTPEINQPYIDANQVHTCRDFNTLHAYMLARRDPNNALYVGNQPRE